MLGLEGLFAEEGETFEQANNQVCSKPGLPQPPTKRAKCGLCGISNQGATCYLNSLLQTLFFTTEFRGIYSLFSSNNHDKLKLINIELKDTPNFHFMQTNILCCKCRAGGTPKLREGWNCMWTDRLVLTTMVSEQGWIFIVPSNLSVSFDNFWHQLINGSIKTSYVVPHNLKFPDYHVCVEGC